MGTILGAPSWVYIGIAVLGAIFGSLFTVLTTRTSDADKKSMYESFAVIGFSFMVIFGAVVGFSMFYPSVSDTTAPVAVGARRRR